MRLVDPLNNGQLWQRAGPLRGEPRLRERVLSPGRRGLRPMTGSLPLASTAPTRSPSARTTALPSCWAMAASSVSQRESHRRAVCRKGGVRRALLANQAGVEHTRNGIGEDEPNRSESPVFGNLVDSTSRLGELETFAEYVQGFLTREQKYLEEEAHPDLESEFLPLFADTFPPILHSSLIISTATLLELEMRGYCEALRGALGLDLKVSEIAGSMLDRFRTYTTKVARLPFDLVRVRWEDAVGLFEIRNCLVHAGGNLRLFQRASVIRAFSSRHGTPVCNEDQMLVDSETSTAVLAIASDFLEEIYDVAIVRFPGHYSPKRRET